MAFVSRGLFSPLVLLVTAILVSYHINGSNGQRYLASVFEFKPVSPPQGRNVSRSRALEYMKTNIDTYKQQARIAGEKVSTDFKFSFFFWHEEKPKTSSGLLFRFQVLKYKR